MKAKLPWVLFTASFLLNVFFAGGVVYSKATADRLRSQPESRLDFVVDELGLTEAERQDLLDLRRSVGERRARMRTERAASQQTLVEEMRELDFDRARVEDILSQRSQTFVAFLSDVMEQVHGYLAGLSQDKRDAFLALMGEERRFLFRLLREPRSDEQR